MRAKPPAPSPTTMLRKAVLPWPGMKKAGIRPANAAQITSPITPTAPA